MKKRTSDRGRLHSEKRKDPCELGMICWKKRQWDTCSGNRLDTRFGSYLDNYCGSSYFDSYFDNYCGNHSDNCQDSHLNSCQDSHLGIRS